MTAPLAACRIPMVPASVLLPNAQRRTHHRVWAPAAADLRRFAGWAAAEATGFPATRTEPLASGPVALRCVVAWPKGRRWCDYQAAVHALKAAVDGLEDARWFGDDAQVVAMEVRQVRCTPEDHPAGWVDVAMLAAEEEG